MGKWMSYAVGILIVAVAVHVVSVWALPTVIMSRTMARVGDAGWNTIHFGKRPDASARAVVRPSPDLLYSTCAYDLSDGPLRVRSPVPNDTYWSVSLFDDATNNFYVLDDRQAHAQKESAVDFVVVSPHHDKDPVLPWVRSPSTKGLVLFRTLINNEKNLAAIDTLRRQAICAPYDSQAQRR